MVGKYIKKPIPVDAWQIDTLEIDNQGNIPDWVHRAIYEDKAVHRINPIDPLDMSALTIITLEGHMTAMNGDYLIKGPKGEYWFNKKHIFEEMYNPVSEPDDLIVSTVENDDGSLTLTLDLPIDVRDSLIGLGVKTALTQYIDEFEKRK
jgi:hypothetical protein